MSDLVYRAADTVIEKYHASKSLLKYLRGPRGSSKTTAAIMEMWAMSCRILPDKDKVRNTRWLLTRQTYPSIERTILKSVDMWLGRYGEAKMSSPPVMHFDLPLRDGTRVKSEWIFMAVPDRAALQQFRSLELTGAFVNECIEQPIDTLAELAGSLNRFPPKNAFRDEDLRGPNGEEVAPYQSITLVDTNPGEDDDPWRLEFEDKPPEGATMLVQQGAFLELDEKAFQAWRAMNPDGHFIAKFSHWYVPNPMATYARIVPGGYAYWANMIKTATDRTTVLKLVCNQWAPKGSGTAVWPMFDDAEHVARQDIEPVAHIPLIIGLDHSGLHPAAAIGQVVAGQLRILDECIFTDNEAGMTFTEFVEEELVPLLAERYAGMSVDIVLDPAIMRNQIDGRTVWHVLTSAGLTAREAPTNDPRMRRDAVAAWLNRRRAFIVSPRAPRVRQALRGGYRFKTNSAGVLTREVVKDRHSHPAEAVQYLCVGLRAASGLRGNSGVAASTSSGILLAR